MRADGKPFSIATPMQVDPSLTICEHCDSVYRHQPLSRGESARCVRCGAVLARADLLHVDALLALTLTTAVVFVLANVYPVIEITANGQTNSATLWQAILALAVGPSLLMAVVCAIALFFVPLAQIVLLAWVLWFARRGEQAPGFAPAMVVLMHLRGWSMVEVFLLGTLVSIVKLAGLLDVAPGPGIWAMAALTFLITLLAGRNVRSLWDHTAPRHTQPPVTAAALQPQRAGR
jgi:paraquat-inducible protein A